MLHTDFALIMFSKKEILTLLILKYLKMNNTRNQKFKNSLEKISFIHLRHLLRALERINKISCLTRFNKLSMNKPFVNNVFLLKKNLKHCSISDNLRQVNDCRTFTELENDPSACKYEKWRIKSGSSHLLNVCLIL